MLFNKFSLSFLLAIITYCTQAQVLPFDGDSLNYRIVGFRVPVIQEAKLYKLEIANGNFKNNRLFNKNITITKQDTSNSIIQKVTAFGAAYTWRVKYINEKGREVESTPLYHFTTMHTRYNDTSKYKQLVITKTEKYKDMLILQDYAAVMYDMDGELVWFIPDIAGVIGEGRSTRNLQPTYTGTFTIQSDVGVFEFDYHGKLLWRAPNNGIVSGDSIEHYHHDFKKLSNGHYLTVGLQTIQRIVPRDADTTNFRSDNSIVRNGSWFNKKIECPTLIEYDSIGNIVWVWRAADHLEYTDYFARKLPGGVFYSTPHLNSFFFDEKRKLIYLSYRNYNRVVKLEYPSGKVLANYGPPANQTTGDMMFRAQHNVMLTTDNLIYMFDNNTDRDRDVVSYVRIFKENEKDSTITKIWEFPCDIDSFAIKCGVAGGSVYMLRDKDILVSMGNAGRSFIVSYDKKILWNCVPRRKEGSGVWLNQTQYRTRCIENTDELKKYIFKN